MKAVRPSILSVPAHVHFSVEKWPLSTPGTRFSIPLFGFWGAPLSPFWIPGRERSDPQKYRQSGQKSRFKSGTRTPPTRVIVFWGRGIGDAQERSKSDGICGGQSALPRVEASASETQMKRRYGSKRTALPVIDHARGARRSKILDASARRVRRHLSPFSIFGRPPFPFLDPGEPPFPLFDPAPKTVDWGIAYS